MSSTYEVLCAAGSDLSYDLIVEVVMPRPPRGVVLDAPDAAQKTKAERVYKAFAPSVEQAIAGRRFGLRIRLFQRLPDPFVWLARIEAAVATADEMTKSG